MRSVRGGLIQHYTRILAMCLCGVVCSVWAAVPKMVTGPGAQNKQPIMFPKAEQEELFIQAIEAYEAGNRTAMVQLMDRAVASDTANHFAFIKRAQLRDLIGDNAGAADDYTRALTLVGMDKRFADVFQLRGCAFFKLGNLNAAVTDWKTFLKLKTDKEADHWQICVAYALLGRYEDGRAQFEWHKTVNDEDMEVALWHFLCVARTLGLEQARKNLMAAKGEKRVPMAELHELFKGTGSEASVWLAVEDGFPDEEERTKRTFYANYYLGLYREAQGNFEEARSFIQAAVEIAQNNEGYIGDSPGGQLRGGDIARVHAEQIEARIAEQEAWIRGGQGDSLAAQLAYLGAGIGLALVIVWGVRQQRQNRPGTSASPPAGVVESDSAPVSDLSGTNSTEAEPELTEKSST